MMNYECIQQKNVKRTRKAGRCAWCGEMIEVGWPAVRRAYRFEGDFQRDRMHQECFLAMMKHTDTGDEGFMPGDHKRGSTEDR